MSTEERMEKARNLNRYAHNLPAAQRTAQRSQVAASASEQEQKTEPSLEDRAAAAHNFKPAILKILLGPNQLAEREIEVFGEMGAVKGKAYFVVSEGEGGVKTEKPLPGFFRPDQLSVLSDGAGDFKGDYTARNRYDHVISTSEAK